MFPSQQPQEQAQQRRVFMQSMFKIDYMNTLKVFKNNFDPLEFSKHVIVNNYLCQQEGRNLHKVTQIIYQNSVIRIDDNFVVNLDEDKVTKNKKFMLRPNTIRNRKKKKIKIFSRETIQQKKERKIDKKNVVKNVVKIFLSWLQKKCFHEGFNQAIKPMKDLLLSQGFNNRLIKKMIANSSIRQAFLEFMQTDAVEQINDSRVQDKISHFEALRLYKNLIWESMPEKSSNEIEEMDDELENQIKKYSSLINKHQSSTKLPNIRQKNYSQIYELS